MSDTTDGAPAAGLPQMPLLVKAQYTKDLSFENPSAPESLARLKEAPQVNVNVGVETRELDDGDWEVTLEIKADASAGGEPVFIVELIYGGVFEVRGEMPDEAKRALLLIECPRLLFPFARDILSSATRDGGLPPLLLQPMDFVQLYRQKYADVAPAAAPVGHA